MQYFYFDTGAHRFLTREHSSQENRDRVDDLVSKISEICGIDLEKGFKPVWAPGLYLERVFMGKLLLTELVKNASTSNIIKPTTEGQLDTFLDQVKSEVSKCAGELLKENSLSTSLRDTERGYAGTDLINDLMFRYNQPQKEMLVRVYLEAEGVQQIIMDRLSNEFRKIIFHSCIKGFFIQFFNEKLDINMSRLILDYSSLAKGLYKNKKSRLIDPNKDLADGEMIHLATFGSWVNDDLVPVVAVTFDNDLEKIRSRLTSFKSLSCWVVAHSEYRRTIPWGKVAGIDKESHKTTMIYVEKLELEPWIYDECSEEASAFLAENSSSRIP